MRATFKASPDRGPGKRARRWVILAAGLLALCLQLAAQVMPADAMQGAMRASALTAEAAQEFAATCLGFGATQKGQPVQPGQHVFCPICVTLAQAQGYAAPDITFVQTIAWQAQRPALPTERLVIATVRAAAFDSQAPPALAVL